MVCNYQAHPKLTHLEFFYGINIFTSFRNKLGTNHHVDYIFPNYNFSMKALLKNKFLFNVLLREIFNNLGHCSQNVTVGSVSVNGGLMLRKKRLYLKYKN